MSDQEERAASSSLEEVFLSGQFTRVRPPGAALADNPTSQPAAHSHEVRADQPLEEVFLSGMFGKDGETWAEGSRRETNPAGDRGLVHFRPMPSWSVRYRAAAAASGVAAVAMVVSVLASGTGPPGVPSIAAAGSGNSTEGAGTGAGAAGSPMARQQTDAVLGASDTAGSGADAPTGPGARPAAVVASTSGANPGVAPSDESGGIGSGSIAPVPTRSSAPPMSPAAPVPQPSSNGALSSVATTLDNAVNNANSAVASTATQLDTSVPATSPVVGAVSGVSATVNGWTQSLALSTA
jgi:DNA segregation ATPase FtsK/SpoIIIE, S-DNA-T family